MILSNESKSVLALEDITDDILDSVDLNDDESEHAELLSEMKLVGEKIDQDIRKILVLEALYEDYKSSRLTDEQVALASVVTESILPNTSFNAKVLSVEHIGTRIMEAISQAVKALHTSFIQMGDYLEYWNTPINLQMARLNRIRNRLARLAPGTVQIRVGVNKWMCHGESHYSVQSMSEYLEGYKNFSESMSPVLSSVATLAEEDLFSSWRYMKEYLFGEPEDFIRDQYTGILKAVLAAKQGIEGRVSDRTNDFIEYSSPIMLGLSRVVVRQAAKPPKVTDDIRSLATAHRHFHMFVDRKLKIRVSTLISGRVALDIKKSDVVQILDQTEKVLREANKLLKLSVKYSISPVDSRESIARDKENGEDWTSIPIGLKLYRRTCSMMYDTIGSGYSFSLGNIKQALSICELALKA